ncbi:MAG: hypothetical protein IKJ00_02185, partial [Clostridia bacterium]|nr:hypothetical protein [Clostridia bacterium]
APQKLSCRVVARLSYSWNYICLSGLQPSKEVFCQAFFQKSGNRVPRVPVSPINHNLTPSVIARERATAAISKATYYKFTLIKSKYNFQTKKFGKKLLNTRFFADIALKKFLFHGIIS